MPPPPPPPPPPPDDDVNDRASAAALWRSKYKAAQSPDAKERPSYGGTRRTRRKPPKSRPPPPDDEPGRRAAAAAAAAPEETKDVGDAGGVGDRLDGALDRSLALRRGEAPRAARASTAAASRRLTRRARAAPRRGRAADDRPRRDEASVFEARSIPFVLRKLHAFVLAPAPSGGGVVVRCFIERNRSGRHALFPLYKLYADHEDGTGRLLVAARKLPGNGTSHYAFSTSPADLYKARGNRSRHYLGKLRANGATSEYTLFSAGDKPPAGAAGPARDAAATRPRRAGEMAAVAFSSKRSAPTNPRRMEVAVPQTRWRPRGADDGPRHDDDLDDGVVAAASFRPLRDQDSLCHTLNLAQGQGAQNVLHADRIAVLHMRESKYDPLSSCLVDFKARANMASVKNFQLVKSSPVEDHMKKEYFAPGGEGARENPNPDAAQPIILQMGKVGKNCFNMDYQFPMSMLQAFATCIARFDTRVAT
ncbi:hypothetical protein JL721_13060 [Aureococcus anophagefferens]|nr:hypothetical protein JL721_13060 [Aureococcus anophagefferens]